MGILTSCCCCCSVRQGSIISAKYTLIYFALFSLLSGSMLIQDILELSRVDISHLHYHNHDIYGPGPKYYDDNKKLVKTSRGTSITSSPSSLLTADSVPGMPVQPIQRHVEELDMNLTESMNLLESSSDLIWTIILGLDFMCEIAGIIVSLLLLVGLRKEKKVLLIPWLIVVPCHIVLDACQAGKIMVESCQPEPPADVCHHTLSSIIFLIVDLVLNLISAYIFLIVLSQYQEYSVGRGTAAYDGLLARNSDGSNFLNATSVNSSHRNSQSQSNRRSYGLEKSDIWCDDFMLDRINNSSPTHAGKETNEREDRETPARTGSATSSLTTTTKGRDKMLKNNMITNDTRSHEVKMEGFEKDTNQKTEQEQKQRRDSTRVRFDFITVEEDGASSSEILSNSNNHNHHSKSRRNSDKGVSRKTKFDILNMTTTSEDSKSCLKVPKTNGNRRSLGSIKTNQYSDSTEETTVEKDDSV